MAGFISQFCLKFMPVAIPLYCAPALFIIPVLPLPPEGMSFQAHPPTRPRRLSAPWEQGASEDGWYKNELESLEAQVTTTMTHPKWQLTEYFHILPASQKPG